ncbi:hypothetical protein [Cellulomonas sp. ICMP 17802]|uniref:hypothetical protein n=1 Tax=Cellulomonas sp. ICMP 17802 TaxID=3239199 RepID=UPI00351BCAD6
MVPLPEARWASPSDEARSALQRASWQLRLLVEPEPDLVGLAVDALMAGLDGDALAELAGADPRRAQECRDLFAEVLNEQDLEWPEEQSAVWNLVRDTAQRIVDGDLDPVEGARWITRVAYHRAEPEGDLRIFVGMASEADDPNSLDLYRPRIVHEAAALLERDMPRRWLRVQADAERPLSIATTRGAAPLDHDDVDLPQNISSQVGSWAREWRDVLAAGGFASLAEAEGFVAAGSKLATSVEDRLGPGWRVEYYPEPIRPPGVRLRSAGN